MINEITFINHASVKFNLKNKTILTDPWYEGAVFHNGWKLIYENKKEEILNHISNLDYIYISHEHPDHFSVNFFLDKDYQKILLKNKTKILFQKFIGMAFLGEFNKITNDNLIDIMLTPENAKNNDLRDAIVHMSLNVGIDNFYNQVKAQLGRPDSTKDLQNIKCPTLIITGREDNICPLKLHKEMAEAIPNSTLKVIEECGHLSTLEQPNLVNNTIIDWWIKTK